jgi:hypothetical protein
VKRRKKVRIVHLFIVTDMFVFKAPTTRSGSVVAYRATNDEAHVSVVLSLALKVVFFFVIYVMFL